jgi:hypothetical protein
MFFWILHCVVWHIIHDLWKELAAGAAAKDWSSRVLRKNFNHLPGYKVSKPRDQIP